jgi:hypothetical protein
VTRWQRRLARALPAGFTLRVPPAALPDEYFLAPGRVKLLLAKQPLFGRRPALAEVKAELSRGRRKLIEEWFLAHHTNPSA